jgi:hypothetical protein
VGFKNYSQFDEDGVIHYIFSLIGAREKRSVEICAGTGYESISANLILNHGWYSLLVDGDKQNVQRGVEFFSNHPITKHAGPKFLHQWIDRDCVNGFLQDASFSGEVDLLVLDLDGVDYWIWEAITEISPRVVCAEVVPHLGSKSVTVPYSPDFKARWIPIAGREGIGGDAARNTDAIMNLAFYGGASLPAYSKLAKRKGYRLVGATRLGINAFFMRNDVGLEYFPEVRWESCINGNFDADVRQRINAELEKLEWVDV